MEIGVPKDGPLPAQGLGKIMAHGDFMLRLEEEVICHVVEGREWVLARKERPVRWEE